jgi:uncharacterized protein (DUF433 family)
MSTNHIELDERGRPWVVGTNRKVTEIVLENLAWGWNPEQIHRQHPDLPLSKIYAAFAYYFDHKEELDAEIARVHEEVQRLRAAAGQLPLAKRLRAEGRIP